MSLDTVRPPLIGIPGGRSCIGWMGGEVLSVPYGQRRCGCRSANHSSGQVAQGIFPALILLILVVT